MQQKTLRVSLGALAGATLFFQSVFSQAAILGPKPYLSAADSPFSGQSFSYFHLENFESTTQSTPGVTISGGIFSGPGNLIDSVDGDDGAIDGSGTAGRSLYANGATLLTFTFDAGVLGALPTHAGIVWTDVGNSGALFGVDSVAFSAFDTNGDSIGTSGFVQLGDAQVTGGTAEDRFFGVTHAGGIAMIQIVSLTSTDWEVDHLQYGRINAIPEPAAWTLLAMLLVPALRRGKLAAGVPIPRGHAARA